MYIDDIKKFTKNEKEWFYGLLTSVGYLMSNPVYAYIFNIYDL